MKNKRRLLGVVVAAMLCGTQALADGVQPVTLKVNEKEPGRFLVQWRVPKQLPAEAVPSPLLPASATPTGERITVDRSGAWLLQQAYHCPGGLSGELVGIEYPFPNSTVTTLLQVQLLSGERYTHMLAPGEGAWRIPPSAVGGAPAWLRAARGAVLDGARHFLTVPVHVLFLISLLLLGASGTALRLVTVFLAAQLVGVAVQALAGLQPGGAWAEIAVAVAAALLAREALRPAAERRQLAALVAAAGIAHGLSLGGAGVAENVFVVLGLDAALLLAALTGSVVIGFSSRTRAWARLPRVAAYVVGGIALALACTSPVPLARTVVADAPTGLRLPGLTAPGISTGRSRRLASQVPNTPLQSFVSIEAFEVRHEVLVRLVDLAERLDLVLDDEEAVAVENQEELKARVAALVAARTVFEVNAATAEPIDRRVDFLTLDALTGALPRPSPVPEPVESAWIGVTAVYMTEATPRNVTLTWKDFDLAQVIPATATDPESTVSLQLTPGQPELRWENELAEDPAPVIRSTAIEPASVWIPLLSLLPLAIAAFLGVRAIRVRRRGPSLAVARILLACAIAVAPIAGTAWALPGSIGLLPDRARAGQILAGLLPNMYRAFAFPTEPVVYDRLALTVTGETLTEVYLEHRRVVEMEKRGGAKARVEAVEVVEVSAVEPGERGGFVAETKWTVGGSVTHFGHRHFRQNAFSARITIVPVDGSWKVQSIEVLDEVRLR